MPNSTSCTDCLPGYYQAKLGKARASTASQALHRRSGGDVQRLPEREVVLEQWRKRSERKLKRKRKRRAPGASAAKQGRRSGFRASPLARRARRDSTPRLAARRRARLQARPLQRRAVGHVGAATCVDCAAGRNQPLTGQADCAPCAVATFADTPGTASCEPCAGDRFSFEGSPYCGRCLRRFYAHIPGDELLDEHASCVHCPLGTTCDGDGQSTTRVLELDPGFWRITPTEGQVYACPKGAVACRGGTNFSAGGLSYCNLGFEGVLCDICSDNYYFDTEDMTCILCDAASKSVAGIFQAPIVIFFLSLLSLLILYLLLKKFREAMQKKIMGKEEWEEMELEKRKQQRR